MDAEDEERGEEENIAMNSGEPGLVGGSPGQEDADDQHDGTVEGSDSAEAEQAGMADPVDADHQHPLIDAEEEDEEQVDYNRSPIIQHRQSPSPDREDPAESSSQERGPVEGGAEEDVGSGDAEGGEPVHAHHSLSPEDVIAAANEEEGAALARGSSPASQDLGGSRAEDNRAAGDGVAAGGEVSKGTGTEDQQPAEGPKEAATRANKYKKITYDIKGPTLPPLVPSSKGGKDGKDHKDGKDKQPGSASKQAGGSKLDQKDVKQDGKSSSKDVGREVKSSGKDVSKDVKSSNTDSKGRADDTARGGSERDKQRDIERERERERQREREKERERQRERERELRDRELRERELRDRDLRERELRDRELRERELRERERERARSQPRQDPRLRGDLHLGPPPPLRSLPPPLDRERDLDREWGVGRSGRSPPRGTYPPPPLPGMYNGGRSPPRVAVRSPPRPLGRSPPRGGGGGRSPPPRGVGRSPPRGPPGRSPPRARDPRDLLDRPPAGPDRYYREDVRVGPYDALRGPPRGPPGPGYRDPRDERPDRLPPPPLDYDRPAFDADHYRDRDRDRDLARDRDRDRDRGMDRGPLYGAGPPGYNSGYGAPRDPPPRDSYRPAALDRGSGFERGLPPGPRVVDAPPPRPDVVPYERSSARDRERDRDHDRGSDRGADPRRAPYPDQLPPASGSTRGGYGDRPLDAPRSSGGSGMDRGGYSGPDVRRPAAEPLVPLPRGATDRLPYDAGRGDRAPDGHGSREPWDRDSYRQPAGVAAGRGPASPPRHQAAARYDAPGQRSGFGSYPAPEYADGGRAGATDPRRPSHPADPRGPAPAKPAPATAYDRAPDVREARRAEPAPADSRDTAGYRFRGSGRLPSPPADMRGRTLDAAPGPAAKRVRVDEYSSRDAYGAAASGARYDVRGREAAEPLGRGADHYAAPGVAARVRDLGAPNDVSARREGTSGGSAGAAAGGNGMGSSAPRPVPGLAAAAVGAAGGGRTDPRAAADGRRVMDTAAVRQSGAAAYVSGSAPALGGGSRPAVSGATASRYQPEQQQADDDKVLKWFYLDPKGQKQGPCSIEQFKGWIETMSLQPSLSAQLQAFLAVDVWSQERPDYKRPLRALVPRK